jgi:hypothetical protein
MAVMGKITWAETDLHPARTPVFATPSPALRPVHNVAEILEFTNVFRGRELTCKGRRICCGILPIDNLIDGGIVRGRISEIISPPGAGKTSLAAAFAANVTHCEAAAWIDTSDDFDPASIAAAGVELTRLLWVSSKDAQARASAPYAGKPARYNSRSSAASLKAAEWILAAGGFGLVILDFGADAPQLSQSAVLRLARGAERCGASVLVLAPRRICGTFAVLTLALQCERACFKRLSPVGPALFEGVRLEASVTRNKLGRSGQTVKWETTIDALGQRSRNHQHELDLECAAREWRKPRQAKVDQF